MTSRIVRNTSLTARVGYPTDQCSRSWRVDEYIYHVVQPMDKGIAQRPAATCGAVQSWDVQFANRAGDGCLSCGVATRSDLERSLGTAEAFFEHMTTMHEGMGTAIDQIMSGGLFGAIVAG